MTTVAALVTMAWLGFAEAEEIFINFQPPTVAAPPGYLADSGALFGDRGNGLSYGWSCDFEAAGDYRDRGGTGTRESTLVRHHTELCSSASCRFVSACATSPFSVRTNMPNNCSRLCRTGTACATILTGR
jgi:hypothetical protein|eukprot:COSAG02_NODE_2935_length_7705_cov_5.442677_7_plen_130_part_00